MPQGDTDAPLVRPAANECWLGTRTGLLTLIAITGLLLAAIGSRT